MQCRHIEVSHFLPPAFTQDRSNLGPNILGRRMRVRSMPKESVSPAVPLEWIEKTYILTLNIGRIEFGRIRFRARQLWTAFPASLNHQDLPSVSRRDLEGVDAVCIPGYPVARKYPLLQFLPGMIQYMSWSDTRFLISIAGKFDTYLQSRSPNTREQLNRKARRWRALVGGEPTIKEFQGASQMGEFYSIVSPLSRKTWQGRIGAGLEEIDRREEILRMAAADQARGYILVCGNRPAAFQLCYVQGTTLVMSQTGYDPHFARFSPGTVLLYFLLAKLFADGEFEYLDLMEGTPSRYKSTFVTHRVPSMRFLYFPRRPGPLCFALFLYLLKTLEKQVHLAKRLVQQSLEWARKPFFTHTYGMRTR
jgi:GNAT acetyltransferase-like protein